MRPGLRFSGMTDLNPDRPLRDARRRQAAMLATEQRWWRDIDRAKIAYAERAARLEATRARWDARIRTAMKGVEPKVWWGCHRRIDAGERWVAAGSEARWIQRVVYVTEDRVLELAGRRDARLAVLEATCAAAEAALRVAVRKPAATFGSRETARRLCLPEWTVTALVGSSPLSPADRRLLCGVTKWSVCPSETPVPVPGEDTHPPGRAL